MKRLLVSLLIVAGFVLAGCEEEEHGHAYGYPAYGYSPPYAPYYGYSYQEYPGYPEYRGYPEGREYGERHEGEERHEGGERREGEERRESGEQREHGERLSDTTVQSQRVSQVETLAQQ